LTEEAADPHTPPPSSIAELVVKDEETTVMAARPSKRIPPPCCHAKQLVTRTSWSDSTVPFAAMPPPRQALLESIVTERRDDALAEAAYLCFQHTHPQLYSGLIFKYHIMRASYAASRDFDALGCIV
jgi:hypothetical protein